LFAEWSKEFRRGWIRRDTLCCAVFMNVDGDEEEEGEDCTGEKVKEAKFEEI
jgi:hypothetical protein